MNQLRRHVVSARSVVHCACEPPPRRDNLFKINGDRDADGRLDGSDVGYVQIDDAGSAQPGHRIRPQKMLNPSTAHRFGTVLADTAVDFCQLCQPGALDTDEDGILDGMREPDR